MISFIHTDLAKGRGANSKDKHAPKIVYCRWTERHLFRCKKCFLRLWLNWFLMYERPKHVIPPENKNHHNWKSPGRNVPRKQVFQDRHLQSSIAGHLSETIHFLSNQSISIYPHRNPRQQKGCVNLLIVPCPGRLLFAALGQQAGPKWLATSLFC